MSVCVCTLANTCPCVLQERLVQAIKRIKHEVDECREAERETYAEAVEVEVLNIDIPVLIHFFFTSMKQ